MINRSALIDIFNNRCKEYTKLPTNASIISNCRSWNRFSYKEYTFNHEVLVNINTKELVGLIAMGIVFVKMSVNLDVVDLYLKHVTWNSDYLKIIICQDLDKEIELNSLVNYNTINTEKLTNAINTLKISYG